MPFQKKLVTLADVRRIIKEETIDAIEDIWKLSKAIKNDSALDCIEDRMEAMEKTMRIRIDEYSV